MKTLRACLAAVAALAMGLTMAAPAPAAQPTADASDNVKLVARFPYENESGDFFEGGTDIDFSGDFVYAMQQGPLGGVHVIDHSGAAPKKVAFIPCPGGQNDVAVVKPGLIALGYHESTCAGALGGGIRLIDVRNPKKPNYLGAVTTPGGTHTLTVYPGKPLIYASPGGLPTNGSGIEQIIDVSDPKKPEIVATFTPTRMGCHDLSFFFTKDEKLAFCAGAGEAQIWDVSDPLVPVTIGHFPVPAQFPHSVAVTHDGKYAVLGDEAIAGNDCVGGPTGAMWIYDIAIREAPVLKGYYAIPRGQYPAGSPDIPDNAVTGPGRNTWCTAHLFNFVPGTYKLVSSWYSSGMNVIDFTDPTQPKEIAHYMGTGESVTNYWSAYWYDGRIYANDRVKGLDVFEVKGLKEGHHH